MGGTHLWATLWSGFEFPRSKLKLTKIEGKVKQIFKFLWFKSNSNWSLFEKKQKKVFAGGLPWTCIWSWQPDKRERRRPSHYRERPSSNCGKVLQFYLFTIIKKQSATWKSVLFCSNHLNGYTLLFHLLSKTSMLSQGCIIINRTTCWDRLKLRLQVPELRTLHV